MEVESSAKSDFFGGLALHGRILMMENLRQSNIIIVNACPLCLQAEELTDHLLLNCKLAYGLWVGVLQGFGCSWVLPNRTLDLFAAWYGGT